DAGECQPARARRRLQPQLHHGRGAARARAHDAVELVRLRRQQQLHRDAASRPDMKVVIAGTGAVCAACAEPADILASVMSGATSIRPIELWDTASWPT